MKITIYVSESGTRSENVEHSDAESHIAAAGCYSDESSVLLAFINNSSNEPPETLIDSDGDEWGLVETGSKGSEDFFKYEEQSKKMKILTMEKDSGTHIISYELGEIQGRFCPFRQQLVPLTEGFELISEGSLNIDTDDDGNPLSDDFALMEQMTEEADAVFQVGSIASHSNEFRIK